MSNYYKDEHKYDDIIGLSRPVSTKHKPMSRIDRAAQFGSFSPLSGHEEALEETALDHEKFMEEKVVEKTAFIE